MGTFKTEKGLELQLMDIKGKPYLGVPQRVMWFRHETGPDWCIQTELIVMDPDYTICKAIIKDPKGNTVATAHKREDRTHFQDHMEKAESSAIGRALGFLGYGTAFALELEEGERLADAPQPKREVVARGVDAKGKYTIQITGKHMGKTLEEMSVQDIESYKNYWQSILIEKKAVSGNVRQFLEQATIYLDRKKATEHIKSVMKEG